MRLIIEEYPYQSKDAIALLTKLGLYEQNGRVSVDSVGYHFSTAINDTIFFLPKVVIDENGKVFHQYNPEYLIDLTTALENKAISDDDYRFLYNFAVWIYRAIAEFHSQTDRKSSIVLWRDIISVGTSGQEQYNTYLDIMLSLIKFNNENQDYFTFILRNIHSGFNKINWTKTINHSQSFIQDGTPIYTDIVNKKKSINYDEDLFIIFFSILQHLNDKYGFLVKINFGYELINEEEFENYIAGYGTMRLEQIRYKYFSDKELLLWQLCYDFFVMASHVNSNDKQDDYLLVKNFNIVFEAMIDRLLSDDDKRIDKMKLKEQIDGKRVDHIYAYEGLLHNQGNMYYIGDSKYYKLGNDPGSESVYKQYTYARNVIQANLNLFNDDDEKKSHAGDDYLVYLDRSTEGYNITPNFFIRAHIQDDKNYDVDDLTFKKSEEPNRHFDNRLFDRDTLLLQHYDINFLYVLSVYGSGDTLNQIAFKHKAHKLFRTKIITEIESYYKFFSLQLKPIEVDDDDFDDEDEHATNKDKMDRLIEQKYFHRLLGKAFRPFKEEEFMYLSLENNEKYYKDNIKLLSDLSQDFNIRDYKLGTDPRDTLNKFSTLTYVDANAGSQPTRSNVFSFDDFKDEIFLVGGYRSGDKNQLKWINEHMMYNVRASANRHGGLVLDDRVFSARYLILYELNDSTRSNYSIYRIGSWKNRSEKWMKANAYENPIGEYLVYTLSSIEYFENARLQQMLNVGLLNEMLRRSEFKVPMPKGWVDNEWNGTPIYLKGKEVSDCCLVKTVSQDNSIVVVDIQDKELVGMSQGYSAGLFIAKNLAEHVNILSEAKYVIYSNKQSHKTYRVNGLSKVSDTYPDGYKARRYGAQLAELGLSKEEKQSRNPELWLSFKVEECDLKFDQQRINKVSEGLTGYDTHIIDLKIMNN